MPTRAVLPILTGLLLAVGTPVAAQSGPDELAVRNYRLSMPVVQKLDAVYRAIAEAMDRDPRSAQLKKLKAEMKTLEDKDEPTAAEQRRMEALATEIERLEEALAGGLDLGDAKSLSEMSRMIEGMPLVVGAVRQAGFTPREFATAQLALVQSVLTHGLMKSTGTREVPKDASPENLKFVAEHEAELTALIESWEKLGKGT